MKVKYSCDEGLLKLFFYPEEDDRIIRNKVKMRKKSCEVQLPKDWDLDAIHPDVLALCTMLIIYPFAGRKIVLPFGVSRVFHEHFKKLMKKEIFPIDDDLESRRIPQNGIPALAYSGGVDSTAALTLLPRTTKLFFLDRIVQEDVFTLYNKEAAHFACESLRKLGRSVYMVKTDLEYIRDPVGFPVDVANAVPALLLSDYVSLDSIAFGTVMTPAYKVFSPKFKDYEKSYHFTKWGKLFEIVGMPFNQVTIGITEWGTMKIAMNSPYYHFAQSCMRGTVGNPCMNCFKCFRKKLMEMTLQKRDLDDEFLSKLFKIVEVQKKLPKQHGTLDLVFAYITSHYKGSHRLMNLLKKKTRGDVLELSWYEKWYSPSIELLPSKYRKYVKEEIGKYLDSMNAFDEQNMKDLNFKEVLVSDKYKYYSDVLGKALKNHK